MELDRKLMNHLVELTQECLSRYWQLDYEYTLQHCLEEVTWIGSTMEQYMVGIEAVRQDFETVNQELKRCHLKYQDFHIAHNSGNSCSVAGRYMVTTDPEAGVFLQVQQRCLFIWVKKGSDEPKIACIYVSNPMGELNLEKEEQFHNALGKVAWRYLKSGLEEKLERKRCSIQDKTGVIHFFFPYEMEYVEAKGHDLYLHLLNQVIVIKKSFSSFMEEYGLELIQVHRSYAVNPGCVSKLSMTGLMMDSGAVIPVPLKKQTEVRVQFKEFLERE